MQLRSTILIALSLAIILAVFMFVDPVAQDPAYHQFADQRYLHGIANFHNTISNLAFLMAGCFGLLALGSLPMGIARGRAPWFNAVTWFYISVMLTGLGSGYYHLSPDNEHMLWDRISITLTIMSLLSAFIADRFDNSGPPYFHLPILLLIGIASVFYWAFSEASGQGDLRAYALVQFLPILIMVYICLCYSPGTWLSRRKLGLMILLYAFAKICENEDQLIFLLTNGFISGHTLKHYLGALATLVPCLHLIQLRNSPSRYLVHG